MRLRRLSAIAPWLLASAGNALASPFYAPPAPEADAPPWSGETELGFTHLAGNTDSQTLIAKGRLVWLTGPVTHSLRGEIRHVTQDDETSAEQYLVAMRERYEIEGPHYLFGFARWDKDRFSGYNYQFTTIAGYGRQLLDSEDQSLSLEAGPGYRFDSVRDAEDEQLAVLYSAMDYRWKFSDTASFSQELSVEATDDNNTSRSLTSLTTRLNDHLALKLSHEIEHNSRPPETATARTDLTTSASVLFDW